ncbi:MAG: ABC transporter ATP-binding protein/permease, partial [Acidobacteria bacterium]|nr:ABC transporter ATP-binding protein/permease [Acidobacteriota bacterium]
MADRQQKDTLRTVLAAGFRLVGRYIAWHPLAFALAVVGATVFASAIIGAAVFVGSIADNFVLPILEGGEPVGNRGLVAGAVLLGIATWKATGIVLRRSAAGFLQFRTQADVRQKLVDHQLSLTLAWYQERSVGDLLAVSDADARGATFVLAPLPYGTAAVVLLVGTVVITFTVDALLGVVVLLAIAAALVVDVWGAWLIFQGFERVQAKRGAVSDVTHESFDGALTVKALGREAFEPARVRTVSDAWRHELIYVGVLRGNLTATVDAILPLATVAILVLGALRFTEGGASPGNLVTVAYLLSQLVFPVRIVGFVLWEMAAGVAAWHRVAEILDADDVQSYGVLRGRPDPSGANVATDAVEFSYASGERVLADVDLTIEPGTTVAVVGPTASGKSEICLITFVLLATSSPKPTISCSPIVLDVTVTPLSPTILGNIGLRAVISTKVGTPIVSMIKLCSNKIPPSGLILVLMAGPFS